MIVIGKNGEGGKGGAIPRVLHLLHLLTLLLGSEWLAGHFPLFWVG